MSGSQGTALKIVMEFRDLLLPAPATVLLIGQLVAFSANRDFSLEPGAPVGGFRHIKNPDSFRATLVQISNTAARAFINGQSNMLTIHESVRTIPGRLKRAIGYVDSGNKDLVNYFLPIMLQNIKSAAEKCQRAAHRNAASFMNVADLLHEVSQSLTHSQSTHEESLQQLKRTQRITAEKMKLSKREAERLQKELQQVSASVQKYDQEYAKALRDIPTGFEALFYSFVRCFGEAIVNVVSAVPNWLTLKPLSDAIRAVSSTKGKSTMDRNARNESRLLAEATAVTMIETTIIGQLRLMGRKLEAVFAEGHFDTKNSPLLMCQSYKQLSRIAWEQMEGAASAPTAYGLLKGMLDICLDFKLVFNETHIIASNAKAAAEVLLNKIFIVKENAKRAKETLQLAKQTRGIAKASKSDYFHNER